MLINQQDTFSYERIISFFTYLVKFISEIHLTLLTKCTGVTLAQACYSG